MPIYESDPYAEAYEDDDGNIVQPVTNDSESDEAVQRGHTPEFAQVCSCGFAYDHRDREDHIAAVLANDPGHHER